MVLVEPLCYGVVSVCGAVTVDVGFCTCVAWVCLVCVLLCKGEGSSPVSLQLLRGGIWASLRWPCLCLWGPDLHFFIHSFKGNIELMYRTFVF